MTKTVEIKTSDLARYILQQEAPDELPDADEDHLIFGKIFEELYTECTWLKSRGVSGVNGDTFRKKLAVKVKSSDISDEKTGHFIGKGYKMYACLLSEDVTGRKPKSQFREIEKDGKKIRIYAQPDLIERGKYYEFKTGPIKKYAVLQSKIFSWVLQKEITLIGLSEGDNGYMNAEKEVVDEAEIDIKEKASGFVENN